MQYILNICKITVSVEILTLYVDPIYFQVENFLYKHIFGVAMGGLLSSLPSNIDMGEFENNVIGYNHI